jgi:hypothetical protein
MPDPNRLTRARIKDAAGESPPLRNNGDKNNEIILN